MKAYPLRNVDDKLWQKVLMKKTRERTTVREIIIAALREAVKQPRKVNK